MFSRLHLTQRTVGQRRSAKGRIHLIEKKKERQTKKLSMIKSLSDELQLELNHLTPMSHDERVIMAGKIIDTLTSTGHWYQ